MMNEFKDSCPSGTNPKDVIGGRKTPFSCVPWATVVGMAVAMLEGALKYGRHNYRHTLGVESDGPPTGSTARASIYFDALMRHSISFWEGEDIDPDSQLLHLDKAAASIAVWRDAIANGTVYDDRPPKSNVPQLIRNMNIRCGEMIDAFKGVVMKPWIAG